MIDWFQAVKGHYERHPYPHYPLFASIRRYDTYALNLQAVWSRFNGDLPDPASVRILLAGCGAFAPYPFSLANPMALIDALDLSDENIRRARLHCFIHRCRNIKWYSGSFLTQDTLPGPYHFIDAFGVLHHLDNPVEGFKSLAQRLAPGGILRVMVYGRYARQEAESIRRAARMLRINDVEGLKRLFSKSSPSGRIREYIDNSWETRTDSGLADLFLHPSVKTYRMDEFLPLVYESGLTPLMFTHTGALSSPVAEIERFRELDGRKKSLTNIICYLGKTAPYPAEVADGSWLRLNPMLSDVVSLLRIGSITPENRLGKENPVINAGLRSFLRRFRTPVTVDELNPTERKKAKELVSAMYLLCTRN